MADAGGGCRSAAHVGMVVGALVHGRGPMLIVVIVECEWGAHD